MRNLNKKQKQILDTWLDEKNESNRWLEKVEFNGYTRIRTFGKQYIDMDDVPENLIKKIKKINDSEILYQEIQRYIREQQNKPLVVIDRDGFSEHA
tara:strand:- start:624 stop:911 length:288 start_codon:yes stop_codon:yes gene_type:complete